MSGGCFSTGKIKDVWTLLPTDLQGLGLQILSYDGEDEFFYSKTSVSVRVKTGGLIESKGGEAPDRVWGPKIHSSSTVIEP